MSVYVVQKDKRTADRKINDTIKLAMLSVEPLRFVGESPQTNAQLKLAQGLLKLGEGHCNLLKDY